MSNNESEQSSQIQFQMDEVQPYSPMVTSPFGDEDDYQQEPDDFDEEDYQQEPDDFDEEDYQQEPDDFDEVEWMREQMEQEARDFRYEDMTDIWHETDDERCEREMGRYW